MYLCPLKCDHLEFTTFFFLIVDLEFFFSMFIHLIDWILPFCLMHDFIMSHLIICEWVWESFYVFEMISYVHMKFATWIDSHLSFLRCRFTFIWYRIWLLKLLQWNAFLHISFNLLRCCWDDHVIFYYRFKLDVVTTRKIVRCCWLGLAVLALIELRWL